MALDGPSASRIPAEPTITSEFDSPWKELLEVFLDPFLAFFFPDVHADLDWDRGYESLDKELQQIVREGELGPRLADKLFRVWPKNGPELWLLVHVEVQNQVDEDLGERILQHYAGGYHGSVRGAEYASEPGPISGVIVWSTSEAPLAQYSRFVMMPGCGWG